MGAQPAGCEPSGDGHRFRPKGTTVHIEPGIVEGSKIALSYATAGGVGLYGLRATWRALQDRGVSSLLLRALATTALALTFFQVFPHVPVGVSEVHLILGSTLFLVFGAAPAAVGLASGLLLQGMFFAPFDLPQYGMNVTTLLVPLFGLHYVANRVIAPNTPYVNLRYRQVLALSTAYQAGIVSWVAFWALYGQGLTVQSIQSIAAFGAAYLAVIVIEPLADLAILAAAKGLRQFNDSSLVERRLFNPA
jgi:ABC-type Co2+ transport system permease subunit